MKSINSINHHKNRETNYLIITISGASIVDGSPTSYPYTEELVTPNLDSSLDHSAFKFHQSLLPPGLINRTKVRLVKNLFATADPFNRSIKTEIKYNSNKPTLVYDITQKQGVKSGVSVDSKKSKDSMSKSVSTEKPAARSTLRPYIKVDTKFRPRNSTSKVKESGYYENHEYNKYSLKEKTGITISTVILTDDYDDSWINRYNEVNILDDFDDRQKMKPKKFNITVLRPKTNRRKNKSTTLPKTPTTNLPQSTTSYIKTTTTTEATTPRAYRRFTSTVNPWREVGWRHRHHDHVSWTTTSEAPAIIDIEEPWVRVTIVI